MVKLTVTGLLVMNAPDFLTFPIYFTCSGIEKNLWIIPSPPSLAIPIAISASVTVSMGEETIGMLRGVLLAKSVFTRHSVLSYVEIYLESISEY